MFLRIVRGKIKPGTWSAYEEAYKAAIKDAGPVKGLSGRWLVQDTSDADAGSTISLWDTEEDLRAYEQSELHKKQINAKLAPFFSGDYDVRINRVRYAEGTPAPDEWLGPGDC
jgi:heme-degrading monooxygenase HmoA